MAARARYLMDRHGRANAGPDALDAAAVLAAVKDAARR
jgi:hypothetical protein